MIKITFDREEARKSWRSVVVSVKVFLIALGIAYWLMLFGSLVKWAIYGTPVGQYLGNAAYAGLMVAVDTWFVVHITHKWMRKLLPGEAE